MCGVIDHLKHIPVVWLTKEESFERCRTPWLYEFAACFQDSPPQCREVWQRVEQCDMPPELCFECRGNKPFDEEDMQLLTVANVEPARFNRGIGRYLLALVSKGRFEETRSGLYVLSRQRQMSEDGGAPGYSKPLAIHLDQ